MSKPSDLIQRATQGDALAVEALLEEHLDGVQRYVRRQMGPVLSKQESSSDIVQSVCREILEHLDRFQYDGEEGFKRWLYAQAARKIKDRHRRYRAGKRDVQREQSADDPLAPGLIDLCQSLTTPSGAAMRQEELDRVTRLFAQLNAREQRIILLAYAESLPRAEIAKRLEITESHVRVLLSRALARLSRILRTGQQPD